MSEIADILDKAADLIEEEGAWCQRDAVRNAAGHSCHYSEATCFCLFGAVKVAGGEPFGDDEAWIFVEEFFQGESPIAWNDAPERTQEEVVQALRQASSKARERQS